MRISLPRRNRGYAALAAVTLTSTVVIGVVAPASSATPAPSQTATRSAVVSGDARFEVLSPTLIRTEYAGDAHFVDAATFNAVGRDEFAPAPSDHHPSVAG